MMAAAWPSKNFIEVDKQFSLSHFFQLVKLLRSFQCERAVVFQAPWFVGLAILIARVPVRIGRWSQWHSFLFFNRGVRQKRSQSHCHESQYNWDLISAAVETDPRALPYPCLRAPEIKTPYDLRPKEYCVVHPGMMGSALNWSSAQYIQLIQELKQKITVVITGTVSDQAWTAPIQSALGGEKNIICLQEKLKPQELLKVLEQAQFVVAPSTGVIHLAAALGTPVVGIYSHRQKESVVRWGPLTDKKLIFAPPSDAPESAIAMEQVSPDHVLKSIEKEFSL